MENRSVVAFDNGFRSWANTFFKLCFLAGKNQSKSKALMSVGDDLLFMNILNWTNEFEKEKDGNLASFFVEKVKRL